MYLTEDLVEQIKDNTSTEFAQGRFSRDTIINICNQESIKRIRPIISDLQAEFFVLTKPVALVAGTRVVGLPKRAAARGLRGAYIQVDGTKYPLVQITREDATLTETNSTGIPNRFYFEADSIVFECPLSVAATLMMMLEISPGKLVLSTEVTKVTSIDFTTGVVVVAGTPSGFGTTVEYDFIQQLGYANAALAVGVTPISVVGTTYTFTPAELPTTLRVGDYLTLAGFTPVPNMPDEAVVTLIHAVSCRIFRFRGDSQMLSSEQNELSNAIIYLERSLVDRAEGERTVITNSNSLLSYGRFRRFGRL